MTKTFKSNKYIKETLNNTLDVFLKIQNSDEFQSNLSKVANVIAEALKNNKKIYIAGNGGSAADAQHFSAELISKFMKARNPLPAIALTTDSSALTAIGNDYGFEELFSRQILGLGQKGDIFMGITTSGKSKNIINAFKKCKEREIISLALCGIRGIESFSPDYVISIPSNSTSIIQEMHLISYHILCGIIEEVIF
tara:strand:+ start:588 stop:1175 length:588 start_codon:yes stop_codon:yes gene_type:complete